MSMSRLWLKANIDLPFIITASASIECHRTANELRELEHRGKDSFHICSCILANATSRNEFSVPVHRKPETHSPWSKKSGKGADRDTLWRRVSPRLTIEGAAGGQAVQSEEQGLHRQPGRRQGPGDPICPRPALASRVQSRPQSSTPSSLT